MQTRLTVTILLLVGVLLSFSGCLSLFQPVNKFDRTFTVVDYDKALIRLAEDVKVKGQVKVDGKWVDAGVGVIPRGGYFLGRYPKDGFKPATGE